MSRAPAGESTVPPHGSQAPFKRRVVLRIGPLPEGIPDLPYQDGAEAFLIKHQLLSEWAAIEGDFPGVTLRRVFFTLTPEQIVELQTRALRMRPGSINDLRRYFFVETPEKRSPNLLLDRIRALPIVAEAYLESPPTPPPSPPPPGTAVLAQGYLDAAPGGIGARAVWAAYANSKGENMKFADVEQGWYMDTNSIWGTYVNHCDLVPDVPGGLIKAVSMPPVWGGNCVNFQVHNHGTWTIGVIRALENGAGCTGIAPAANGWCVCEHRPPWGELGRADAILAATYNLEPGDVLLLEMQVTDSSANQSQLWPVEIESASRDVIITATAIGIVVIEATGNGKDEILGIKPLSDLDQTFPALSIIDSGAVLVAGASSVTRGKLELTRYGSRVDCFAWGDSVETTDGDVPLPGTCGGGSLNNRYHATFNGSSSASAILAGAALVVQSLYRGTYGFPTSATRVRDLLSDPANTASEKGFLVDRIGVMPDLAKIAARIVPKASPDIYLRDYVGDTGAAHTGPISNSPDIIVRRAPVANPTGEFGPGSGHENDDTLSQAVRAGMDHYLYVRLKNLSAVPSGPVAVNVYWSEVGTLIQPWKWNHIGAAEPSVVVPNVPPGGILTVSDTIKWPQADVPDIGHYCFVALVDCLGDPAPHPLYLHDWDAFLGFIRNNNNVTWRNFNVIASWLQHPWNLPFLVSGASNKNVRMMLGAEVDLPPGVQIALEVPEGLSEVLGHPNPRATGGIRTIPLRSGPGIPTTTPLGAGIFPAGENWRCHLRLVGQPPDRFTGQVSIYQRYVDDDGPIEVGRVTWRFTDQGPV